MGGFDVNHARATLLSLGAVNINGVPVNGQIATWFDLDTIEGSANFTFDGSTLALAGSLAVSGVGPHAISGAVFGAVQLLIGDTFTSDGSSTILAGIFHTPTLIGAPGDTLSLSGSTFTAAITTQTAVESIADVAQTIFNEPFITDNLTGLITRASTVLITGAPDEGVDNYALRVAAGLTSLVGDLELGASPALTGTLRLSNASDITMRSTAAADLNVWSSPNSDEIDLGDVSMPVIRIRSSRTELCNQLQINGELQGETTFITTVEAIVPTPSGASATAASLIPAGAFLLGITTRVITAITGPAGFDIGDGVDVDRWGNSIAVGLGTTSRGVDFTSNTVQIFPTANDVVLTSDGVDFTGGSVRVIAHYISFTGATS